MHDLGRRLHKAHNHIRGLIRFRRLVERSVAGARAVDAGILHFLDERLGIKRRERLRTAHGTTGTVRRRAVPILVALACGNNGSVAHVEGDKHRFPSLSADRSFANNPIVRNVVVHGGETGTINANARALQNLRDDRFAILVGKLLAVMHVGKVLKRVIALQILKLIRDLVFTKRLR